MSTLTTLPASQVESDLDMESICPKKLFIYCENKGINRINHFFDPVWETKEGKHLYGYDELNKYLQKDRRKKRPKFLGWDADVN